MLESGTDPSADGGGEGSKIYRKKSREGDPTRERSLSAEVGSHLFQSLAYSAPSLN
ncbi:hypothetical protein DOJK_00209 [Patescibacteria group bacterium]|nr:hypothetical protein DOJK_00209 [Patescibacteria group bacterium]